MRELTMKHLLLAATLLCAIGGLSTRADAQNYPWCAVLNVGDWSSNCGFVTEEQCRTSVSGVGGFCMRNTTYIPPESAPVPWRRGRHSAAHY
jgi:Protein of unknown function (DUF3551)